MFAKKAIKKGQALKRGDVYFAFPFRDGQLSSGEFREGMVVSDKAYKVDEPVALTTRDFTPSQQDLVYHPIHEVKAMLNKAGIALPIDFSIDLSHHYGLENFAEFGLTMLNIVNREYCKKLLILLPGQRHPTQYHERKEETFHVLYGDVDLKLGDIEQGLVAGDIATIERGESHAFGSRSGAVIEEISTTHSGADSFYLDPAITMNPNRKTLVTHWMA